MQTKLTLRLDEALIRKAKRYADQTGKSVSQLVAEYFSGIPADSEESRNLTPRVRRLAGAMSPKRGAKSPGRRDYTKFLEAKLQ